MAAHAAPTTRIIYLKGKSVIPAAPQLIATGIHPPSRNLAMAPAVAFLLEDRVTELKLTLTVVYRQHGERFARPRHSNQYATANTAPVKVAAYCSDGCRQAAYRDAVVDKRDDLEELGRLGALAEWERLED
jgi:hypothetical protein